MKVVVYFLGFTGQSVWIFLQGNEFLFIHYFYFKQVRPNTRRGGYKRTAEKQDQIKSGKTVKIDKIGNERGNKKDSGSKRLCKPEYLKNSPFLNTFLPDKESGELENKENESELSFNDGCSSRLSKTFTLECFYC